MQKGLNRKMKYYINPRIEIIYTTDITTSSPETGFIPFGTTDEISFNAMNGIRERQSAYDVVEETYQTPNPFEM
jgi:hypothetical protein